MSEAEVIARTPVPRTARSLAADLRLLGVAAGDVMLVHSSLSALGWVAGGASAVIEALLSAVGPAGTIVMPAQSGQLSDPVNWRDPPVPPEWIETLRAETPPFDRLATPTRQMGEIAELFRTQPGALRSNHPTSSFSALGPKAALITDGHQLESPLGERSPLMRLYELEARVLLLGVGFECCTALHLAEQWAWPTMDPERSGSPIMVDGQRQWVSFDAPGLGDSDQYGPIGTAFVAAGSVRSGSVGSAPSLMFGLRDIVDFATAEWRSRPIGHY
jgi:aminoglycoside 3-N-acetyltransferase